MNAEIIAVIAAVLALTNWCVVGSGPVNTSILLWLGATHFNN